MIRHFRTLIDFHPPTPGAPRRAAFPWMIILAGCRARKDGCQEIFSPHPLNLRSHAAAIGEPEQRQGPSRVPAPPSHEHRGLQNSLDKYLFDGVRMEKSEDHLQREAMLLAKRQHDPFIRRGGLQFKIKRRAKALSERKTPGPIDPPAERRMEDQLHAAGLVKKSLRNNG